MTFSITARSSIDNSFGVAVSTARPNVGSLVPFVSLQGAIATQGRVNTDLGRHGLSLLAADVGLPTALQSLLDADDDPDVRQVHGLSASNVFAFTGKDCIEWAGHRSGSDFCVAGNMLTGPDVLEAMADAFEATQGQGLSDRLLLAMEAGQAVGGDKRGRQSAALLIASPEPRFYHNLRIDDHADPVAELRRIHDLVVEHSREIEEQYGVEGLRLFSKVKY